MKRLLSAVLACVLLGTFSWATNAQPSVTYVKATHQRTQRHHAHKAARHHRTRHPHGV